ncbi:hypothetical protein X943_001657 [Babesia divergens]|uniref:U4/U6.U5 small nuclear ribonucleoprotein 27kDa protein domain-containing protein n=1 Tax=Babesia divergens TaxID=32595 RepID=A0AAD9G6V1_BABDI|nr:hypothetical protein X943_001657 [Babesia divergens]
MESRSRYRSRSADRRRDYRDSPGNHSRYNSRGDRNYVSGGRSRGGERFRDRSARDVSVEARRRRDESYGREDRYERHPRDQRYGHDRGTRGRYRDVKERISDRSVGDDTEGRTSPNGRGTSRHDDHRNRYEKGHRKERRRSRSNDSTCSFGSRVSFGREEKVEEEVTEELDEESLLMKAMGFGEFATTKNKQHLDSDVSGVAKRSKRQYRQYMNRRGGFNRPLSPTF